MNTELHTRRPRHVLKEVDRTQKRITLASEEMEALVSTLTAVSLLQGCLPLLEGRMKEQKLLAKLKSGISMVTNAASGLMDKTALVQLDQLAANTQGVTVKVSSDPTDDYTFTNIQTDLLRTLTSAVRVKVCRDCFKSKQESMSCRLRAGLDASFHSSTNREIKEMWGICPYCSDRFLPDEKPQG